MKRTEPQSIRDVLETVIRQADMETELLEHRAALLWPRTVGEGIMRHCGRPSINKGILTVPVSSPAMRQELSMMKRQLLSALNAQVGKDVIKDIRFVAK